MRFANYGGTMRLLLGGLSMNPNARVEFTKGTVQNMTMNGVTKAAIYYFNAATLQIQVVPLAEVV
ncbi:MAG: hypothetical protein ACK551_01495 [Vampirovibrionales bacterium]